MFNNKSLLYHQENSIRIYNENISQYDMFYSELLLHLNNHIKLDYKIYYLECSSNHDFSLNLQELGYLYTQDARYNESLYYCFSENIKRMKYFQRLDLFFLTSLKNLGLLILIPKLDKNNRYYFNLILGVKKEFNIEQFNKLCLKSVNLNNFVELNIFNLSENYMSKIFDIEKNKFRDHRITDEEAKIWQNEIINKGSENSKLSIKGRRIYKKIVFKHICFHLYWLDGKHQLNDSSFQIDYDYKEKFLVPDKDGGYQIIESDYHYCLEDLIGYNPEYFCFNSWKIYRHL